MTTGPWSAALVRAGISPATGVSFERDCVSLKLELIRLEAQLNAAGIWVTTHVEEGHRSLTWSPRFPGQFALYLGGIHSESTGDLAKPNTSTRVELLPPGELANVAAMVPLLLAALTDTLVRAHATRDALALREDVQILTDYQALASRE